MNLLFIAKIIALIFGLYHLEVGAFLMILFGYFHLIKSPENIESSPDWVIARHYFGTEGVPIWIHKIVGAIMIGFSLYWIFAKENKYTELYSLFVQIVILVIIFELVLRKIILDNAK